SRRRSNDIAGPARARSNNPGAKFCHWLSLMAQGTAWTRPSVGALVDDDLPVDNDVFDAVAVLKGLFISGAVDNALLVEDRDIGKQTGLQQAAVANADLRGA